MKALLPLLLAASLSGCGWLDPLLKPVPAGTVTGVVLFNGKPAAGKRVALAGAEKKAYTDASGRYTFTGVTGAGRLYVSYVSTPDRADALPNEILQWASAPFALSGNGQEVPPFDVAYNGLLYPGVGLSLIVNPKQPVPFHWSMHAQAQAYRVKLTNASGFAWSGEWASDPTGIFAQQVTPGTYYWAVEIDGGSSGSGLTRSQQVDF